jgi:hypothetical protein
MGEVKVGEVQRILEGSRRVERVERGLGLLGF